MLDAFVDPGDSPGRANVGHTAITVAHFALAAADSIDDCEALRAGAISGGLGPYGVGAFDDRHLLAEFDQWNANGYCLTASFAGREPLGAWTLVRLGLSNAGWVGGLVGWLVSRGCVSGTRRRDAAASRAVLYRSGAAAAGMARVDHICDDQRPY